VGAGDAYPPIAKTEGIKEIELDAKSKIITSENIRLDFLMNIIIDIRKYINKETINHFLLKHNQKIMRGR
jgi:hypothetical protein